MTARKYWYRFYIELCPVCGKESSYKERVYGEKPEYIQDRHLYLIDSSCHCCYSYLG